MQQARTLVGDQDSDDLLNWLDAHCVSASRGAAMHVLRERWAARDRGDEALAELLANLIESQWIELVPGLSPPHLRLTPSGYSRLLAATHFESAEADGSSPMRPTLFVTHERSLSEIALRNQLLMVFREHKLKAEDLLIGITVVRYWQETGVRASDLRMAFNVLLRDQYLRHRVRGIDTYWQLTEAGAAYLRGPLPPPVLLRLAPEIGSPQPQPPDGALRDLVCGVFTGADRHAGSRIPYGELRDRWRDTQLDENALLHALDLAYKAGLLTISDEPLPVVELTALGAEHRPEQRSVLSKLAGRIGGWLG